MARYLLACMHACDVTWLQKLKMIMDCFKVPLEGLAAQGQSEVSRKGTHCCT